MAIEDNLKGLIHQLVHKDLGNIQVNGANVSVCVFEQDSKLSLSTIVYYGGNYIPKSVRKSLSSPVPFSKKNIKTYLLVDELNFHITLNYLDSLESLDREKFKILLEEFSWQAEEWRYFFDEHDRQDLIHINVK
jgi:hypothetical protein